MRSRGSCMRSTSVLGAHLLALLAILMILGGVLLPGVLQQFLDRGIRSAIVWRLDSPADVDARYRGTNSTTGSQDFVEVWLFNITNIDDIRQGKKPVLEEVGPFTYRKFKIKVDVWWDASGQVATKEYDYYIEVPERTRADLNSTITTLNLPLIGVIETIHSGFGPTYQWLLDLLVFVIAGWHDGHVDGLFTKRTAAELIWGYEDLLLQRLSALSPAGTIKSTRVELLHNMTGPEEALALEPMLFDSGANDLHTVWNTLSDSGHAEAACWNNCTEKVHGTDGTQFHPAVTREERLPVWVSALYRAEDFIFQEDVEWLGVKFLRFRPDPVISDPDECHYQRIKGLMNLTIPKAVGWEGATSNATGPPIYLSQPHFCMCDEALAEAVDGLKCDLSRHTTHVDVEPMTGISMRGHTSMMMSSEITAAARLHLEPIMAKNSNSSTVMPIFWFQEDNYAANEAVLGFRDRVYSVLQYKQILSQYMPAGGFFLLAVALVLLVLLRRRVKEEKRPEAAADAECGHGQRDGWRGSVAQGAQQHGSSARAEGSGNEAALSQPLLEPGDS